MRAPANQPTPLDDLALFFAAPPPGELFTEATQGQLKQGHGRRETRQLRASTALTA
jgi:hypothetical protein